MDHYPVTQMIYVKISKAVKVSTFVIKQLFCTWDPSALQRIELGSIKTTETLIPGQGRVYKVCQSERERASLQELKQSL